MVEGVNYGELSEKLRSSRAAMYIEIDEESNIARAHGATVCPARRGASIEAAGQNKKPRSREPYFLILHFTFYLGGPTRTLQKNPKTRILPPI